MRVATLVVLAMANIGMSAFAEPKECSTQFVRRWDAWNRQGKMPTPDQRCVMRRTEGQGVYLCDKRGCGRS